MQTIESRTLNVLERCSSVWIEGDRDCEYDTSYWQCPCRNNTGASSFLIKHSSSCELNNLIEIYEEKIADQERERVYGIVSDNVKQTYKFQVEK